MEDAVSAGVLRGRPFGGVSISWSPDMNHLVTPLTNYKHKRVVAVELVAEEKSIIIISVYMPYFNSSKRVECMQETLDAISMIELLIEDHPEHLFIIGGDLNTELKGNSSFDPLWDDLATKSRFAYCDANFSGPQYTYHHDTLGQRKFNDHFVVSKELLDSKSLFNHKILDEGENTSDHLPILMSLSQKFKRTDLHDAAPPTVEILNWDKVTETERLAYGARLSGYVAECRRPETLGRCRAACRCDSEHCKIDLQSEYDKLTDCILKASSSVPRFRRGVQKDWWTPELTRLKDQSIAIHEAWVAEGRPPQGATHWERLRVRAAYKRAVRHAKREPKQDAWNRMHGAMEKKDSDSFWKWWRSVYCKNDGKSAPVVENCTTRESIANVFQDAFIKNAEPNNRDRVEQMNAKFDEAYPEFVERHNENCDCDSKTITLEQVIDATLSMKSGKSADDDGIQAEHFLNAPLNLLIRLTSLFNLMLAHAFVPRQFRFGTVIPIIKDRQGNSSDAGNYRGITISPIASKLFEHVLKILYADHMYTSSHQYGFKRKCSTTHALFCLKETIDYYIDHGSSVYCCFLDASKAFDRLVHSGLFIKLMERNVPLRFLNIIISWYGDLQCRVKWDGYLGGWFAVSAGVRQGGVLSPDFYSIYVDKLICMLMSSGIGCYLRDVFAAGFFYADDMAIVAPSVKGLQRLLNICESYCDSWDICLNSKKTKSMYFGKKKSLNFQLSLNGVAVDWEEKWKYLGVVLKSGKRFGCSVTERVKSFYRSLNSILRVEGRSDDMVLLRLLEAHCLPILSYAVEALNVADRDERRSLRVAYNAIYRKVFSYKYNESVTALQHSLGRPTWEELVENRQSQFIHRARKWMNNTLVKTVVTMVSPLMRAPP